MLILTYDSKRDCVSSINIHSKYRLKPQALADKFYEVCGYWPNWLVLIKHDVVFYRYFCGRDYSEEPKVKNIKKKICYLVRRSAGWANGWVSVAVYLDRERAQILADSFGIDEEWNKQGLVVEVPLEE